MLKVTHSALLRYTAFVIGTLLVLGQSFFGDVTPVQGAARSCSGNDGIYLYEDRDYRGRCIRLTEGITNLADADFDDIVSSIRIRGDWIATLYADPEYNGALSVFTGDDANLDNDEIKVNRTSSVRVYRGRQPNENRCDGGEGVYLYEDIGYRGYCVKLTSDRANLDSFGFNDATSSVRIVGAWTATLYESKDFRGTESSFSSDDSDLRDDGIDINRTSSVRVRSNASSANRCDGNEGIYLYADSNYAGRCVRLTSDQVDLRTVGFDDTAESVRVVGSWVVILYADLSFNGASSSFTGDDSDLANDGIGTGRATSARIQRPGAVVTNPPNQYECDGSAGVYLYEDAQFGGRCIRITSDLVDLRVVGFDDTASSIRIVGGWTAVLFRDLSGSGASSTFTADDADLSNDGIGDNQATSIQVRGQGQGGPSPDLQCNGAEGVYIYEHPQFGGRCLRFTSDAPDLRAYGFDDTASSVHIVGPWTATLFRDLNGTGIATIFTADDTNLADDSVGDNQATSVQVRRR